MPEWTRFEGGKYRSQQIPWRREEKERTLHFDSMRVILRPLPFRSSILVLLPSCFNDSEEGVKHAKWQETQAKQRKAEVWNSFFNYLFLKMYQSSALQHLRPLECTVTHEPLSSIPSFHLLQHILNGYL